MIGGYFTLLLGVAWWVVARSKNTAADYFLAGRNLSWWIVGASIFASNIGSEHVVGLAGSGAKDGVAMAHYELHAWCLLDAGLGLRALLRPLDGLHHAGVPGKAVLDRLPLRALDRLLDHVRGLQDRRGYFCRRRGLFACSCRKCISSSRAALDIDSFWIGSVLVIVLTGLYTVLGGMRAVAYNDAVQTIVLICGSATLTIYGLWKLGSGSLLHGWTQLHATCRRRTCSISGNRFFPKACKAPGRPCWKGRDGNVVREAWYFNTHFPWLGMAICAPVIGLWYWCTDQYIVQRALGAPNEKTARRGSIFAAFLKLFPVYLFIVPGLICYALSKNYIEPKLTGGNDVRGGRFQVQG